MVVADAPPVEAAARAGPARWPGRLALAATALCAALVIFQLGDKSLWYDEAFSIGTIDRPFGDALWRLAHWEVNMSPFYLALAGWWRLGQGEAFLRLLPAVCSVLAVPAVFALGRRLVDARVGAVAALLLAVHPMAVQWGQQLRGYSLVLLLVIVATTLLLRAVEVPGSARRALAYGAVAAVATYAHFFAALVVGAHTVWLLVRRPLHTRLLAVAGAAYGVLVLPLGWYLLTRDGDPLYWVSDETGSALVETATTLAGGSRWGVAAYAAAGAAALWFVVRELRSRQDAATWRLPLLVAWVALPVLVAAASTLTVKPLLEGRFLIVVVPGMALLAGLAVVRLGARAGSVLLAALVVASALGVADWYDAPGHEDWRGATRLVAAAATPDTAVVVEPWGGVFALRFYEERLDVAPHLVLRPGRDELVASDRLVEVQRVIDGVGAYLLPSYVAWRDEHFVLRSEEHVRHLVVRTFEAR